MTSPASPLPAPRMLCVATGLVTALLGSACGRTDNTTQITLALLAETRVPDELSDLEIVVTTADGSEVFRTPYRLQQPDFFPTTLAIVPRNSRSLEGPITIDVSGAGAAPIKRRAVVSFVEGRTLLLQLPLRMACLGFRDCGPTESCVGGACIPAAIESASLPDYDGERIFPTGATPCFDEAACLEQEQLVPLQQDCTFALPPADSTSKDGRPHVNVAVQWRDAPRRIIALEYGNTQEGWTVTAEGRGKLSAGVCLSYFEPGVRPEERAVPEKAEGVYVSVRCPAHDPAEPFCRAADGHVAVGRTFR